MWYVVFNKTIVSERKTTNFVPLFTFEFVWLSWLYKSVYVCKIKPRLKIPNTYFQTYLFQKAIS